MQVIIIKANRLERYARHTSQQLWHYLPYVRTYTRIQDATPVFTHPHHMVFQSVYARADLYIFMHTVYHRRVHSPTGKPVVLCLRPHRHAFDIQVNSDYTDIFFNCRILYS